MSGEARLAHFPKTEGWRHWNSGGGCMLTTRTREDGKYVVVSDELIGLYASPQAFEDGDIAEVVIEFYE